MEPNAHVRIGGDVWLYSDKAPFVKSGFGDLGALRLNTESDTVMCHECGDFFKALGPHLPRHQMTAREYKLKHGLKVSSCLVNEKMRAMYIRMGFAAIANLSGRRSFTSYARCRAPRTARKSFEISNIRGNCQAQLLQELRELGARLKRTPTVQEVADNIGVAYMTITFKFGSYQNAMLLAGLEPRPSGHTMKMYRKGSITRLIRSFYFRYGRIATRSDFKRGLLPSRETLRRHFGSTRQAFACVGIPAHKSSA